MPMPSPRVALAMLGTLDAQRSFYLRDPALRLALFGREDETSQR